MKKIQDFTLCLVTYYALTVVMYVTFRLLIFYIPDKDFVFIHAAVGILHALGATIGICSMVSPAYTEEQEQGQE